MINGIVDMLVEEISGFDVITVDLVGNILSIAQ